MDELLQSTFAVGMKGIKPENVEEVERLILSTIDKVVEEGFSDEAIASSMNTIEFQVSRTTNLFPQLLSMFSHHSMPNRCASSTQVLSLRV